jgi:hypothetical protein
VSCPACRSNNLRPLIVLAKEGFPPGDSRHNIAYSHDAIFICDDCLHGYAEKRRHDCFDFEEVWDQDGIFPLDPDSIANLTACLPGCPEPTSETCDCEIHRSLRSSWQRLALSSVWVEVVDGLPRMVAALPPTEG